MRTQRDGTVRVSPAAAGTEPARVLIAPRTIWLTAAIIVALFLAWIVLTRGLSVFVLLFISIIFAEGIRPLVDVLHRVMPRAVAILLIYLVLLIILAGLAWLLAGPVINQAAQFGGHLPQYIAHGQHLISHATNGLGGGQSAKLLDKARSELLGVAHGLIPIVIHAPLLLLSLVFQGLTILFLTFMWLTSVGGLKGFVVGLLPPDAQDTGSKVIGDMGTELGGYVRGLAVNVVIAGILVWFGLLLLGVPYAILLGVLAGLTNLIPVIGTYVAAGSGIIVALLAVGPLKAGEVWLFYMVIQQLQGGVIQPMVMNRIVNINPLTVLVSTLLGAVLLGVVGAVIAVPVAIVIRVLVLEVLAPAVRRSTGSASPTQTQQSSSES